MVKLVDKESIDPKISDFEADLRLKFFKIIIFNMFVWFYQSLLIYEGNSIQSL